MSCVRISAHIIHWPALCACCCRPADTSVEVSSTRVTGKRVIRTQTKGWKVPYCTRCLDHIDAARALRGFSGATFHLSIVFGLVGAALSVFIFLAFICVSVSAALIVGLLSSAATVAVVVLTFRSCQAKYRRELRAKEDRRARLEDRLERLLAPSC